MEFERAPWRDPAFRQGAQDMSGPALGIAAWGLVTGVAMVKSGMSVSIALATSLLVFAGSAQLATLPLLAGGAPLWVIWATAACVNLRFVILGTQWRPYFGHLPRARRLRLAYFAADLNVVLFMQRYPRPEPAPEQEAYFWGGAALNYSAWQLSSIAGILLGDRVPTEWGLGFAGILVLIGLIGSMLNTRSTWAAAAVAAVTAVASYGLPYKLNIVLAVAAAIVVGMLMDHRTPTGAAIADDRT
ncbi:MAG: AzlC family ABC transporter permease [Rubrivivax sp.]